MKKQSIIYELQGQRFLDFLTAMISDEIDFEKDDIGPHIRRSYRGSIKRSQQNQPAGISIGQCYFRLG